MSALNGRDPYGLGDRKVEIDHDKSYVTIQVEGNDGRGDVILTPAQARWLAAALTIHSEAADKDPSEV
jgi:hypothetical protein